MDQSVESDQTANGLNGLRILFKVLGGPEFGMGNVTRSLELAREFQRRGAEVRGFCCNPDPVTLTTIRASGFPADATDGCVLAAARDADAVILDHVGILRPITSALREHYPGVVLAALDYFDMGDDRVDLIINLINQHPTDDRPPPRVQYREGTAYAIIRERFDAHIARVRPITPSGRDVLVTFGGSDPRRNTLRVCEAADEGHCDQLHLTFVLGANYSHKAEVQSAVSRLSAGHRIEEDVSDIQDLMRSADVAVCGAGTTMLELAALGTPAVVIPQNENETRFAARLADRGAVIALGILATPQQIGTTLTALATDPARRGEMSRAGREIVDGRGRHRIVEQIVQLVRDRRGH
jgi:spore coat polysaccharide biosynthesis predicted glycosyltransferase SpsG